MAKSREEIEDLMLKVRMRRIKTVREHIRQMYPNAKPENPFVLTAMGMNRHANSNSDQRRNQNRR